jgi:hypothetical protein
MAANSLFGLLGSITRSEAPVKVGAALRTLGRVVARLEALPTGFVPRPRNSILGMRKAAGAILGAVAVVAYLMVGLAVIFGGLILSAVPFAMVLSGGWLVLEALVNLFFELLGLRGPGYDNLIILFEDGGGTAVGYALRRGGLGLATLLAGLLLWQLRWLLGKAVSLARRLFRHARAPRAPAP